MMVDEKADLMFDGLFDHIDDLLDFSNEDDFMVDGFSSSSTGMATCCHKQEIGTSGCAQSQMVSAPPPLLLLPLSLPQDNDTYTNTTPLSCCTGPVSSAATAQPLQEEDPIIDPLDIKQLEWLSDFFEDSFTPSACIDLITQSSNYSKAGSHNNNNNKEKEEEESQFRTSSPVSVLEPTNHGGVTGAVPSYSTALFPPSSASPTSSACSGVGSVSNSSSSSGSSSTGVRMMLAPDHLSPPEILVVPGRARTKRPRPATFNPRSRHMLTPPLLDGPTPPHLVPHSEPGESFDESNDPLRKGVPGVKKKNKKKKNTNSSIITATSDGGDNNELAFPAVRKCMHCEIQKTPQWRAGPMGPKTLCNACGVRYKSGRLFPEYRPAASPTFVPTLHSNSHKKVVEMRNQIITQKPPQAQEVKGLLDYIRRLE